MADARPALDAFTEAFALTATALPVSWGALTASVIWDAYKPDVEASADVVDYDSNWAAFRRDEVAAIEVGDTFTSPRLLGDTPTSYRVSRVDRSDSEFLYVAVGR